MFKEMRRKDKCIDDEQAIKLLNSCQYGVLSTVGEDGYAYGVPINYVYHKGNIYFHGALEGHKLDNIFYNNKVSFCVIGDTEPMPDKFSYKYESVIVFGQAAIVNDMEKEDILIALIRKYSGEFLDKGIEYIKKDVIKTTVIKIDVEHITGKAQK